MGAVKGMYWFYGLLGMMRFLLEIIENRTTRRFSLVLEYDSDGSRRKRETPTVLLSELDTLRYWR
jgi:hypothetical protein